MKILLAESDPNIRYGLNILSEQLEDRLIMGEVTNSQELLRCVCASCPDVLLVSQNFPGLGAGDLLEELHQICPQLLIIVLNVNPQGKAIQLPDHPANRIKVVQNPEQLYSLLEKTYPTQR